MGLSLGQAAFARASTDRAIGISIAAVDDTDQQITDVSSHDVGALRIVVGHHLLRKAHDLTRPDDDVARAHRDALGGRPNIVRCIVGPGSIDDYETRCVWPR